MKNRKLEFEYHLVNDNYCEGKTDMIELFSFEQKKDITVCVVDVPKEDIQNHYKRVAEAYMFRYYMDYEKLLENRKIIFDNELCVYKEQNRLRQINVTELMIQIFKNKYYNNEVKYFKEIYKHQSHNDMVDVSLSRYIEFCNNEISKTVSNQNNQITGFKTTHTEQQITNLYNASQEYIETDLQNLVNTLNEKECNPITWKGNKVQLRAFIIAIFQNPKEPQNISKKYFRDIDNNIVRLSKPVKTDMNYQNYIDNFKDYLQ